MEGMSSDAEDGLFSSEEEDEHNVENFMLCSCARHACSPLLQGFLHEKALCKVALACHFSLDVIFLWPFWLKAQGHFIQEDVSLVSSPQWWLTRWQRPLREKGVNVVANGWSGPLPSRA